MENKISLLMEKAYLGLKLKAKKDRKEKKMKKWTYAAYTTSIHS